MMTEPQDKLFSDLDRIDASKKNKPLLPKLHQNQVLLREHCERILLHCESAFAETQFGENHVFP